LAGALEVVLAQLWLLVAEAALVKLKTSLCSVYKVGTHSQSLWVLEVLLVLAESIPLCGIRVLISQSQPIRALLALRVWALRAELVVPALDRAMSPTTVEQATARAVLAQVLVPQPMAVQPRAVKVARLHQASQSQ
jgi:hypothetical protein